MIICCTHYHHFQQSFFEIKDLILLIVGILGGIITTWFFFYWQFKKSSTHYRLSKVIAATNDIINYPEQMGQMRDRYRYSLSIMIEALTKTFGHKKNSKIENHFPNVSEIGYITNPVDGNHHSDRWRLFDFYIRPVINDINVYSFLGSFPVFKDLKQLGALSKLCFTIEDVVAEIDACKEFEINHNPKIEIIKANDPGFIIEFGEYEPYRKQQYSKLFFAYDNLEKAWKEWLDLVQK